jgi:hypothetical protein
MGIQQKGDIYMKHESITIDFDLDREPDKTIYDGVINLPKHFGGNLSESFMMFFNSMVQSLSACEEKKERCEELLLRITSKTLTTREGNV